MNALQFTESPAWYALRVRARSEALTSAVLRGRGFDPYYPARTERRRYSDRTKDVEQTLIPGYVFCRFDAQRKLPIVSAPGVNHILAVNGVPIPIQDDEIEHLRRVVEAGAASAPYLRSGQKMIVRRGSLRGVEGFLLREPSGPRLVVSIHLLSRSVAVELDRDDLDVVGGLPIC